MATARFEGDGVAVAIDGLLGLADRRRGLEGDTQQDRLPVRDTALDTARAVGVRVRAAVLARRKGEVNRMKSIDPVAMAIALGGSFAARSFSGDRDQLVPLIKAGVTHPGCAVIDIVSPCVTFNDHVGSTKSYAYTREHYYPAIQTDFVPPAAEIKAKYDAGDTLPVTLHDGSVLLLKKTDPDYDHGG